MVNSLVAARRIKSKLPTLDSQHFSDLLWRLFQGGLEAFANRRIGAKRECVLIALMSLAAEGTPRMAIELCRAWIARGARPILVVLQSKPVDLAPEFDALGLEKIILNIGDRGYLRYLRLIFYFLVIARRRRAYSLVSMPLGWHAFMALGARMGGAKQVIAHVGNYPNAHTVPGVRKFYLQVQLGRPLTSRLVCCSRYVKEGAIQRFRLTEAETAVVYNGVPIETFAIRAAESRKSRTDPTLFTIGMVARLEVHKDQPTLIRAARILRNRGVRARVWLVGEGSRRREFEGLIKAEGIAESVHLLGMRRDIPELLGQMDVFVYSTTPDEGLGIALIEAMAAGVPVVASDVGACREVLDDGALGRLFTPGDGVALADAIHGVHADSVGAASRLLEARCKALREFSAEAMANRYAALLKLPALSS
jgi:glycosyltransferase involved in cell wall biosynthesis